MKSPYRMLFGYSAIVLVFCIGAVLTFKVRWKVCSICGQQSYERSIYGVVLAPMSLMFYDPTGSAVEYMRTHPGAPCQHDWAINKTRTLFGGDPDFVGPRFDIHAADASPRGPDSPNWVAPGDSTVAVPGSIDALPTPPTDANGNRLTPDMPMPGTP